MVRAIFSVACFGDRGPANLQVQDLGESVQTIAVYFQPPNMIETVSLQASSPVRAADFARMTTHSLLVE
jgi:hypothetical protein